MTDSIQSSILRQHRALSAGEIAAYKAEGFLLLRNLLSAGDAAVLRREVLEIMEKIGLPTTKLMQTTEYLAGSAIDGLVNSVHLLSIAAQLMEGASTVYMPFTAVKSPGGGRFHFHQDNQYTRFDGPGINLWIALNSMSVENGCLQVVPRSHLAGTLESDVSGDGDTHKKVKWEPKDFVPMIMQPGDCVAFSRLTVHGSGHNSTGDVRVGYAVQFHRNDVKAEWDGQTHVLKEHPRWKVKPVKEISIPKGKKDGH